MQDLHAKHTDTLSPLPAYEVSRDAEPFWLRDEDLLWSFQGDGPEKYIYLFTNRRLVLLQRQSEDHLFYSLPYPRVLYYTMQARGFGSYASRAVLRLIYQDGPDMTLSFTQPVDLQQMQLVIAAQQT